MDDPEARRWVLVIVAAVLLMTVVVGVVNHVAPTDPRPDRCEQLGGVRTTPTTCTIPLDPEETP